MHTQHLNHALAIICCSISLNAAAAEDDIKAALAKPYVTVNGQEQPTAQAEILLREQTMRGAPDSQALRDGVREVLVNQTLMEQEARKVGLDKEPLVQAQIARVGDKEYLVRHLLVGDEATAKLLIEKLQSGGKIADLAKEYSRDAATQDKGKFAPQPVHTELGWHVLQLEDTRPFKAPTLEAINPQLTQLVARRLLQARVHQ